MLAKDETKHVDMMDILEDYKKYIPSKVVILKDPIPQEDTTEDKSYVTTLLGGDYLSVARAREAQYIRSSSERREDKLDGMLPVAEDWHAKVVLLEVSTKKSCGNLLRHSAMCLMLRIHQYTSLCMTVVTC